MKYTLGLILLTPFLALKIILNDTKMSISELNRLDTVSKRSKKDRLINELNEAKKKLIEYLFTTTLCTCVQPRRKQLDDNTTILRYELCTCRV